jgi:hypothetical protein
MRPSYFSHFTPNPNSFLCQLLNIVIGTISGGDSGDFPVSKLLVVRWIHPDRDGECNMGHRVAQPSIII